MQKIKTRITLVGFILLSIGCNTSPKYNLKTYSETDKYFDLNVITLDSRRIIHECMDFEAKAENSWRHHYYMYFLDNENNVFKAQYPTDQDIDSCTEHLKKIEKIFKSAGTVKMCIRGEINKIGNHQDRIFDFKELGKHSGGGRLLDFDSICNSKDCYSINETWVNTCPGFDKHSRK